MIWTNEKVNDVSEQSNNLVMNGPYVNQLIVLDMRDDYEAALEAQAVKLAANFVAHLADKMTEIERLRAENADIQKELSVYRDGVTAHGIAMGRRNVRIAQLEAEVDRLRLTIDTYEDVDALRKAENGRLQAENAELRERGVDGHCR